MVAYRDYAPLRLRIEPLCSPEAFPTVICGPLAPARDSVERTDSANLYHAVEIADVPWPAALWLSARGCGVLAFTELPIVATAFADIPGQLALLNYPPQPSNFTAACAQNQAGLIDQVNPTFGPKTRPVSLQGMLSLLRGRGPGPGTFALGASRPRRPACLASSQSWSIRHSVAVSPVFAMPGKVAVRRAPVNHDGAKRGSDEK